jgi:hypothetical protein
VTPHETDAELEHVDDDDCRCAVCEREAIRLAEERAYRSVHAVGGIAPWAHEALGPGWVDADGKGGTVQPINTADLAQRALGEVFEQLERVAHVGRERCAGGNIYSIEPFTDATRITRQEAVDLCRMLGDGLDYARIYLDYLKRAPSTNKPAVPPAVEWNAADSLGVGDRVIVADDENSWDGEITGFMPAHDGPGEAMVRDGNGKTHPVDVRDVRRVAI